ncbi:hypothetical protein K461DRAFT_271210 [Myriangium duriaei CBS 260.36]|uniref:trans-L-3-hydroxyproline dehydratase n=1 Tax=Myriangium duriaei CBS 260.36 TaxID=1168546 RepID=A0A9P4IZH9_9PEZI|nr:hypothetical protein K461DRAFT_271210 [Myriangium duriaei CBS 260.36]
MPPPDLHLSTLHRLKTVDMHVSSSPVRIVYSGMPSSFSTISTVSSPRHHFTHHHDSLRHLLLSSPRAPPSLHAALILPCPTARRTSIIRLLFLSPSPPFYPAFSTPSILALARFLVDFPSLIDVYALSHPEFTALPDPEGYPHLISGEKMLQLATPAGTLDVTVPVTGLGKSDPSRETSFVSPPAWASEVLEIPVPRNCPLTEEWMRLQRLAVPGKGEERRVVEGRLANGGGGPWYFVVLAMGSPVAEEDEGGDRQVVAMKGKEEVRGVAVITDILPKEARLEGKEREDGMLVLTVTEQGREVCPPVAACVAALYAENAAGGKSWVYYSPESVKLSKRGGVSGELEGPCTMEGRTGKGAVRVRVEGFATYTGLGEVIMEKDDCADDWTNLFKCMGAGE